MRETGFSVPPSSNENAPFLLFPHRLEELPRVDRHRLQESHLPPDKKRERFADSGGLYLEVSPNGSKRWFWKYRKQGKEGRMALGSYPDVGLAAARTARDTAKNVKAGGFDPVQERKVGQRPNELRGMAWAELDLEAGLWSIAPARMKRTKDGKENGAPHLVPLPKQAIELLRDLHPLTGHTGLVFPGERGTTRPISDNTLRAALQTLGYASDVQTVHGFRATARTILAERLEVDPLIVEAQLAHVVKDANGRAYNRTSYIEQRRTMMQTWADYLDKLRTGANIIPLHAKAA